MSKEISRQTLYRKEQALMAEHVSEASAITLLGS